MLDIDLGRIVTTLGENTITDVGEPLVELFSNVRHWMTRQSPASKPSPR